MQRHQDAEAGHERHHRAAAVAHERERHADDGEQAAHHAGVHEHVYEERDAEAPGNEPRKSILRFEGHEERAPDHEEVEADEEQEPEESELLADHGEDEVRAALRQELELRLAAVHPALAEDTARADRDLRLDDVIARAE